MHQSLLYWPQLAVCKLSFQPRLARIRHDYQFNLSLVSCRARWVAVGASWCGHNGVATYLGRGALSEFAPQLEGVGNVVQGYQGRSNVPPGPKLAGPLQELQSRLQAALGGVVQSTAAQAVKGPREPPPPPLMRGAGWSRLAIGRVVLADWGGGSWKKGTPVLN